MGLRFFYLFLNTFPLRSDNQFVKIDQSQLWLAHAVTGESRWSHALSQRSCLIGKLKDCVEQACIGELTGTAPEDAPEDPMADLDSDEDCSPSKRLKRHDGKRVRYTSGRTRVIVEIPFPNDPPQVRKDDDEGRMIKLYIEDRKKIWLHVNDLSWAVRWIYAQIQLKGVEWIDPESTGPSSPCRA